jgi:hypothetical protein
MKIQYMDNFAFFRKSAEIFANQGAPPVSTTPVVNLPPVSTTLAANFATSTAGVVDTGGKFACWKIFSFGTSVSDTGHLELLISPRIFEKIRNGPNCILRETDFHEKKKPEVENLVALTLKVHKNENFFGFDFEFCTISMLVMHKK